MTRGTAITLMGDFKIASVSMIVGINMNQGLNWSGFIAAPDGKTFPTIVQIATWIGQEAMSSDLSQDFTDLKFDSSAFDLAPKRIQVDFVVGLRNL